MSVLCDKCGQENEETLEFCRSCGEVIIPAVMNGRLKSGVMLDGRYEIISLIKKGGMGAVYKALDHRFGKKSCAVKEMLADTETPEEYKYLLHRFKKEGEILHELRHPNLPVVQDYFTSGGRYYLVMDLIEGNDLYSILKNNSMEGLPEEDVIRWAKEILDAISYLHSQSPPVIYRDLKPSNIMIRDSDKKAILVDFGIARRLNTREETMTTIGTPAFAPEELLRGKAEPRSDIYSLGATMHCLVSGDVPVIPCHFLPLNELKPYINPELEAIIMKALSLKADDRFFNAMEMKEALEELSGKEAVNSNSFMKSEIIDSLKSENIHPPSPSEMKKHNKLLLSLISVFIILSLSLLLGVFLYPDKFFHENVPEKPDYIKLGDDAFNGGNYKDAEKNYISALEVNKNDLNALSGLGKTYRTLSNYKKAMEIYSLLLKQDGNNKEFRKALSNLYVDEARKIGEDNPEKAIDYYLKAMKLGTEDKEIHKELFSLYLKKENYKSALKELKIFSVPEEEMLNRNYFKLGKEFFKVKNYKYAIECFEEALQAEPLNKEIFKMVSECYIENGEYKKTIEENKRFIASLPEYKKNGFLYIGFSYYKLGEYGKADKWLQNALEQNQDKDGINTIADCYLNMGYVMLDKEEYDRGEDYFSKTINLAPENLKAIEGLALCYYNYGVNLYNASDFSNAEICFENVINLNVGGSLEKDSQTYLQSIDDILLKMSAHPTAVQNSSIQYVYVVPQKPGTQNKIGVRPSGFQGFVPPRYYNRIYAKQLYKKIKGLKK